MEKTLTTWNLSDDFTESFRLKKAPEVQTVMVYETH